VGGLSRAAELWRTLELRAQVALVASAVAVLGTAYFLFSLASKPSYTVVASGLSASEGADVANSLESAGIAYELRDGGGTVAVQSSQTTKARVQLAEDNLPNGGHDGFELFDSKSLGSTDFEQKVKYQRALEGEIARTVESVDGVRSAQVQLVLPKQSLFLDDGTIASAAVLLESAGMLDGAAVSGIARLVSSSVEGLKPENVTITDETGSLLWPNASSAGGGTSTSRLQAEQQYANAMSAQIDSMLISTLGPNKAFARVHADLDLDQQTIESVTYGTQGTKLSDQTDVETLEGKGGTASTPATAGTNGNVGLQGAAGAAGGESKYSHRKGSTTFGVDKTVESKVVVPGAVKRLSIALVVDKKVPAADVAALEESVAALVGVNTKRGDTINVSRVAFGKQEAPAEAAEPSPIDAAGGPLGIGKWVLLTLGALAFLFFVRRGLKRREGEAIALEPTWLREVTESRPLAELEAGRELNLSTEARRQHVVEQVEEIVRRQPETVANQVTQWMRE
jgi:flagellar M-ring protein FliF